MTNEQIIANIAVSIYGEDKVMKMVTEGIEIPLHTLQGWSSRGYKVLKGEKGFECRLWKKKNKKNNNNENDETDTTNRDFYLCKSFLFRYDQVERAELENG